MDIRQLRYFIGVVEAKSLNKASALLHVAQPALSTQIRNLERDLGVKLLHRHARGIVPTKAGERLAQHAYQLLRQVERVRSDLTGYAAGPSGGMLMCIARSIPLIVTTAIAERCQRKFPGVHLRIVESWRQQAQADRLAADFALTFRPEDDRQFLAEPLVQDELVLTCSADDPQVPSEIDLRTVFKHDVIVPSRSNYLRRFIESAALSLGQELRVACEIDSFALIKELVARRMAKAILPIACMSDDLRSENLRIVRITDPPLQRTLYMLHSARQARSGEVDLVREEVRAIIFECADRGTFGWHRIPVTDSVSADPWHDDHALAPSLDGNSSNAAVDGIVDLGHQT